VLGGAARVSCDAALPVRYVAACATVSVVVAVDAPLVSADNSAAVAGTEETGVVI